jgi:hypothetical protein
VADEIVVQQWAGHEDDRVQADRQRGGAHL